MEKYVYDRREILKKLAYPITLKSEKTGELLGLGYSRKTGKFGVSITEKGVKDPTLKRDNLSEEEILPYLSDSEFAPELDRFFGRVEREEKEYTEIRTKLLEQLEKSKLEGKEREDMREIIEKLSSIPSYSLGDHRISVRTYANREYESRQYIRIGNEYDRNRPISPQLITRVIPMNGTANTNYRKIDFDEMVSILRVYKVLGEAEQKESDEPDER